jgi:hypothetical protein
MFAPQSQVGSPHVPIAQTELTATFGAGIVTTGPNITVSCWVSPSVTWRTTSGGRCRSASAPAGGGYIRLRRTDNSETPAACGRRRSSTTCPPRGRRRRTASGRPHDTDAAGVPDQPGRPTDALFVNGVSFAATVTGTMPSSMLLLSAILGDNYAGTFGHLQIYDSTATADHTLAAHQAQYAVGITGLAGQTTGSASSPWPVRRHPHHRAGLHRPGTLHAEGHPGRADAAGARWPWRRPPSRAGYAPTGRACWCSTPGPGGTTRELHQASTTWSPTASASTRSSPRTPVPPRRPGRRTPPGTRPGSSAPDRRPPAA